MAQTILADMDSWKRVAGAADADGAFTVAVFNADEKTLLTQILAALNGIRARLDGGIKTQAGTISVNV